MLWQCPDQLKERCPTKIYCGVIKKLVFFINTIKAIITIKNYLKNYSCNEFYNFLLKQNELLDLINSSEIYVFKNIKELQLTSE